MGELEPRVEELPGEEKDVVLRVVNPIIESYRSNLEANGVNVEQNEGLIREMLVHAFEGGVGHSEEQSTN